MSGFRHSLRFRLTVWYCVALAAGLGVFGLVLYWITRYHLLHHHDRPLLAHAATVRRVLAGGGPPFSPEQLRALDRASRMILIHESGPGMPIVYRSEAFPAGFLAEHARTAPWTTGRDGFRNMEAEGEEWRVFTFGYRAGDGREGVVHLLTNLGNIRETLRRLELVFMHLAPLGILISFLGGYWISGQALAPIVEITEMAREIEATSLDRRLPHPGVACEVGRLVETLNRMIARLEASFEAMKRFTADASHELRSPLATVRNAIDLSLSRPRSEEEQTAALVSIGEEVDRIRSIVEDLLLFARVDAGRVAMQMKPVRLDQLVEAQVEAHQHQAAERGLDLRVAALLRDGILGDERWLHQVIGNLLDNALKYTPVGGWVRVEMRRRDHMVEVAVHDSGPGVPEEDLAHVFERFFRADPARSQSQPGVGLGLAIAAWIVGAHQGQIRAMNRPEGGATFVVSLPLAVAGAPEPT